MSRHGNTRYSRRLAAEPALYHSTCQRGAEPCYCTRHPREVHVDYMFEGDPQEIEYINMSYACDIALTPAALACCVEEGLPPYCAG